MTSGPELNPPKQISETPVQHWTSVLDNQANVLMQYLDFDAAYASDCLEYTCAD